MSRVDYLLAVRVVNLVCLSLTFGQYYRCDWSIRW